MLKRIRPDQAILGMYVRKFDGGWLSHPFWRARFVVRTDKVLARLRDARVDFFIDPAKGLDVPGDGFGRKDAPPADRTGVTARLHRSPALPPIAHGPARRPAKVVAPLAFGKADKARATALALRSTTVVSALFEDCRLGKAISTDQILAVVDDIANALEQNSSAFISVTRLKTKDDGTYTHSVAVCALMIGLAREAGIAPKAVQAMGTAGLLHDIGKVLIDDTILKKTETLTEAERAEIRRHPQLGHRILSAERGLPAAALDVCLHHHERLNGSGYPFGLKGEAITPATRMATICDVYDALTSHRPYKEGMAPVAALALMEDEADGLYDPALMFKFMRSIAVFPPGKLIRLRSNRLAVALPSAGDDRRPLARAFYSTIDTHHVPYEDVVLSDRLTDDQAVSAEDAGRWFSGDWDAMAARIIAGRSLTPAADAA